jgi:hypothetical protein
LAEPKAPAWLFNQLVVAGWTLIPPIWFWVHWYKCPYDPASPKWERMTHGHEVSRNLWVALVIILAVLFDIHWPGG